MLFANREIEHGLKVDCYFEKHEGSTCFYVLEAKGLRRLKFRISIIRYAIRGFQAGWKDPTIEAREMAKSRGDDL